MPQVEWLRKINIPIQMNNYVERIAYIIWHFFALWYFLQQYEYVYVLLFTLRFDIFTVGNFRKIKLRFATIYCEMTNIIFAFNIFTIVQDLDIVFFL